MILRGRTAVITGSNRGIGLAILRVFAENGANIVACARKESSEFTALTQSCTEAYGVNIDPVFFDFANEADVKAAVSAIVAKQAKIDIVVNNAGIAMGGLFRMTPIQGLKQAFQINFFAQVQFIQGLSRTMIRAQRGSIINIGSTAGLTGSPGTLSYGSSKAALMYATKNMAAELGAANVRVNAIAPGLTKTDMFYQMDEKARCRQIEATALGRAAEASEIANVALFLASDLSTYVSGQVIRVDGGMTT